jgi:hypothetical protein
LNKNRNPLKQKGKAMTHDPLWPFPQYDAQGRRILPPAPPPQKRIPYPADLEEALL